MHFNSQFCNLPIIRLFAQWLFGAPQQSCRAHPFPLSELLRRTLTKVLKRALSAQEASCCCFNCVTVIVGVVGAFDCWHSHVTHSGVMPHYHCCAAALPGFFSVCPIRKQWQLRNGRLHEMAKWNAPNVIRAGHIPIAIAIEKMPIANCQLFSGLRYLRWWAASRRWWSDVRRLFDFWLQATALQCQLQRGEITFLFCCGGW